jgi:signal transduction histidine kinase
VSAASLQPALTRLRRRNLVLLLGVLALLSAALATGFFTSHALTRQLAAAHATQLTTSLTRALAGALAPFDEDGRFIGLDDPARAAVLQFVQESARIDRLLAFDREGVVQFDSQHTLVGDQHDGDDVQLAFSGDPITHTLRNSPAGEVVAEVYVPVKKNGHAVGVLEIYLDTTDYVDAAEDLFELVFGVYSAVMVLAALTAVALLRRSLRHRQLQLEHMAGLRADAVAARDRLFEAFGRQRRFSADAAHALRTPLAVLRARVDGFAPGVEREGLIGDVTRMTRLVDRLLLIARLEAQHAEVVAPLDLGRLAGDVVAALFPLALRLGLTLALEAPELPVRISGDAPSLMEALENLIDNAMRYSPAGSEVVVRVLADPPRLQVRDFGPGVAEPDRVRLFEAFAQGQDRNRGGAGLGLAIVARVMAMHGGRARCFAPEVGAGTIFELAFPGDQTGAQLTVDNG